ncbi:hypothetical protein FRB91_000585 [Serendipita sp. 411]|nr:hypothetical protein FRC16_003008 [Serendipita sp. 398]KAG8806390.1 hypothetical protein FRC19_007275 [Serendipita sp. 401]KAG8860798.1 hypothetical protein FRB91_000585 [Serendipita sp. 411]KAG9055682.1 hypothetical protein FS842_001489 [Serendipita sp. 407]
MVNGVLTPLEIQALGGQNIFTVIYDVYITRWFSAIALSLICYDNLLTLSDEVDFLWPKRWSSIKVLLHLNRLVSLCFISANAYTLVGTNGPISNTSCEIVLVSTGCGAYLSFSMCNWILLARTQAVLCHRPLGNRLLLAYYIVSYSITGILVVHTSVTLHGKIFYSPTLDVCGIAMRPSTMGFIWLAPLIFETTTFLLTIRKLYENAAEEYALGSKLFMTLYRDGVCYYLVIIGMWLLMLASHEIGLNLV